MCSSQPKVQQRNLSPKRATQWIRSRVPSINTDSVTPVSWGKKMKTSMQINRRELRAGGHHRRCGRLPTRDQQSGLWETEDLLGLEEWAGGSPGTSQERDHLGWRGKQRKTPENGRTHSTAFGSRCLETSWAVGEVCATTVSGHFMRSPLQLAGEQLLWFALLGLSSCVAPTLLIHMCLLASGFCSCFLHGSAVAFCSLSTWFSLKHLCTLQEASTRHSCFLFNQVNANLDTAEKGPLGLSAGSGGKKKKKNLPATQETQAWSWVRKTPWRREWQPTPVFLPGASHGKGSLAGYSPWGCRVRPRNQNRP